MRLVDYYWDHPELAKFVKQVPAGQYLFKQKQFGTTMFVIVKGIVELIAERDGKEFVIGFIESGQFLGEKAITKDEPYRRAFSARTKSETKVVEMDLSGIEEVRKKAPDVMHDILKHMFQIAAQRLERANYLIAGLRSGNAAERLLHLILYFARSAGRPGPKGVEFMLNADSINYYIDMPATQITECIDKLTAQGLLVPLTRDFFVLPSERALLESLPLVKKQLGLGYFDTLELEPAP